MTRATDRQPTKLAKARAYAHTHAHAISICQLQPRARAALKNDAIHSPESAAPPSSSCSFFLFSFCVSVREIYTRLASLPPLFPASFPPHTARTHTHTHTLSLSLSLSCCSGPHFFSVRKSRLTAKGSIWRAYTWGGAMRPSPSSSCGPMAFFFFRSSPLWRKAASCRPLRCPALLFGLDAEPLRMRDD